MRPYQKINHFVGTNAISRKNYLARNLLRMKAYYPKEYKFFPHTWSLPADLADFRCQFTSKRRKTFIIKPDASSQGRGIFLTRNIEDIDPLEHLVAQRYLHKPFLIDGLKFDLRIYVLLAGCNPLRLFVHQDGLVRFATSKYAKPTGKNLGDKTMHLTNYAINKSSSNFTPNRDPSNPSKGHKRSLFHVLDRLRQEGHDVDALCREIDECLCKTIIAIQPSLAHIYGSCKGEDLSNSMCFEVLGIDIMIDHKLTPWLIEVNHSPSFSTDSELDFLVKFRVIRDALVLLGVSSENRRRYHAQQRIQAERRRMAVPKQTRDERLQDRKQMMNELAKSRTEWEDSHLGGWRRIYPTEERAAKYGHLFEAAQEIWQSMTGMCKTKPILTRLLEARRAAKEMDRRPEAAGEFVAEVAATGTAPSGTSTREVQSRKTPKKQRKGSSTGSSSASSVRTNSSQRCIEKLRLEGRDDARQCHLPLISLETSGVVQPGGVRGASENSVEETCVRLNSGMSSEAASSLVISGSETARETERSSSDSSPHASSPLKSVAGSKTGLECDRYPTSDKAESHEESELTRQATPSRATGQKPALTIPLGPKLLTATRQRAKKPRSTLVPLPATCPPLPWNIASLASQVAAPARQQPPAGTGGLKLVRIGELASFQDVSQRNRVSSGEKPRVHKS
ncbi:tubulin-tyrosine ligase family protein [Cystoisospora suis]|uniref:Tubulin-tyrosine ligase family protein n=1 Tax=Cystoisospora suis TaxID=483139 RepID=A0A2C6KZG1_9APIC|nr:tubulin-tyrosine ligase family protein [Cystoisospora suis]